MSKWSERFESARDRLLDVIDFLGERATAYKQRIIINDKTRALWRRFAPLLLLLISFFALGTTFYASWSCDSFTTESLPEEMLWYFGGGFGVWTVMDGNLECQLWSTLFFAKSLDPFLHAARATSMISMLSGLAALAVLTQALNRWANGICVVGLLLWMGSSYGTFARFNLWSTFFGLTYLIFIVAARNLRHYYVSLQRRIVRFLMAMALIFSVGIFSMLAGSVCSCDHLRQVLESEWFYPQAWLDDEDWTLDLDNCFDSCQPLSASPSLAPIFWFFAWLLVPYCWVDRGSSKGDSEELQSMPSTVAESEDEIQTENPQQRSAAEFVGENLSRSNGMAELERCDSMNEAESELSSDEDNDDAGNELIRSDQSLRTRNWLLPCSKLFLLSILVILYVFLVVVMVGAYVENGNAAGAPDTSHNFVVDTVCAVNPLDPYEAYVTFDSKRHAMEAGYSVVHCGECASCSNPRDIETYVNTRKTVAKSAKKCSKTTIFGEYEELVDCLEEEIGFSRPCTECWADNMKTTAKYCLFTCLSSLLTGNTKANNLDYADDYNWLNQCIYCDEKRSGPAFVQCSGVARRRLGIQSEIERNHAEQCRSVDVDYINATAPNSFFDLYQ